MARWAPVASQDRPAYRHDGISTLAPFLTGASAVESGPAHFTNSHAAAEIEVVMARENVPDLAEIVSRAV
jgi:hypothetical protein